jgi:UDP-glucuronate 4-epimerase
MNFLVTGGAGFIGSHVCGRLLDEGHAVWAFDDLNGFYDPQIKQANVRELQSRAAAFTFVVGDLTDAAAVEEVVSGVPFDQVIHLAARAGVRPSLQDPALYQRVNVEGTVNLLESARKHGVRKVTLASSSSVYGVNAKVPFSESDPIQSAISPYAASKLACEALGHVYHHVYGMDVAMLRFFTVYGPRQRPDLAIHKFARLIAAGKPIPVFGDGTTARDYTYVSDTVDGVMACTRREFGYEVFNLGESGGGGPATRPTRGRADHLCRHHEGPGAVGLPPAHQDRGRDREVPGLVSCPLDTTGARRVVWAPETNDWPRDAHEWRGTAVAGVDRASEREPGLSACG